jgi:hypothetical protein
MKLYAALIGFTMLGFGCVPPPLVVPSQKIPHQLSKGCNAEVLVEHPNGQAERQKFWIPPGWWVASPEIVEGSK